MDLHELWFQQDVATAHSVKETKAMSKVLFPNCLLIRFGEVCWLSRSLDLTTPDFFIPGCLKDRVYANQPSNLVELKNNFVADINKMSPEILKKALNNAVQGVHVSRHCGGGHLQDIIFKYLQTQIPETLVFEKILNCDSSFDSFCFINISNGKLNRGPPCMSSISMV